MYAYSHFKDYLGLVKPLTMLRCKSIIHCVYIIINQRDACVFVAPKWTTQKQKNNLVEHILAKLHVSLCTSLCLLTYAGKGSILHSFLLTIMDAHGFKGLCNEGIRYTFICYFLRVIEWLSKLFACLH